MHEHKFCDKMKRNSNLNYYQRMKSSNNNANIRRKRKQTQKKERNKKRNSISTNQKRLFCNPYLYLFLVSFLITFMQQKHTQKKRLIRKSEISTRCTIRCNTIQSKPLLENTRSALKSIVFLRNGNIIKSHNSDLSNHIKAHLVPIILRKLWFEKNTSDTNPTTVAASLMSSSKGLFRMKTINDEWESALRLIVNWAGNDWKGKSNRLMSRKEKACRETCTEDPNIVTESEKKEYSDFFWSGISWLIGCSYINAISMYGAKVWRWHDSIVFIFQVVSCTLWLALIKFVFHYLSNPCQNMPDWLEEETKQNVKEVFVKKKRHGGLKSSNTTCSKIKKSNDPIVSNTDFPNTLKRSEGAFTTEDRYRKEEVTPVPTVVNQGSQEEDGESFSSSLTEPSTKSAPMTLKSSSHDVNNSSKPSTIISRPNKARITTKRPLNGRPLKCVQERPYRHSLPSPTVKQREESLRLLREYQSVQIAKIIKRKTGHRVEQKEVHMASFRTPAWQPTQDALAYQDDIRNNSDDYSFSDELLLSNMLDDDEDEKDDLSNSTSSQPALTISPVLSGVSSVGPLWGTGTSPWVSTGKTDRGYELWNQSTAVTSSIISWGSE